MLCDVRAVLLVTRQIEGTSTNLARQRFELRCGLEAGHAGPHLDAEHDQEWDIVQGRPSLMLRDEDEPVPQRRSDKP